MTSKYKPGTLPEHRWCTRHRTHLIGCDQLEHLLKRSGRRCEICGLPGSENPRGKLHIDHDHQRPQWAVRGLLCHSCNVALTEAAAEARPSWAVSYLANSWWEAECERVGVSTEIAPEPDFGSAFRDQFGALWLREGDGLWRPQGNKRPGINSATWKWLYDHRGPHNMALLDPYAADGDVRYPAGSAEREGLFALLAEVGTQDVPLYAVRASGRLLVAFMGGDVKGSCLDRPPRYRRRQNFNRKEGL